MRTGKENQETKQAESTINNEGPKHAEQKSEKTQKQLRENTSASTTGGGCSSASAGTTPAAGCSATTTGTTGAGGAGSSAIEKKAGAG